MLGLGVAAQVAGTLLVSTPAYLIPLLHQQRGLPLSDAGLLAATPTFGMVLTLIAWGALADRYGERWVLAGGLGLTALCAVAGALAGSYVGLGVALTGAGAAAASANVASGRVVVGWFPRSRRGFAMGIRQIAQPLGVAIAALVVPTLADHYGISAPLLLAAGATGILAVACAIGIADPPRRAVDPVAVAAPAPNPYRESRFLVRIHALSMLLVVPQFTLSTFGLVWLIAGLHWSALVAGLLVGGSQIIGAGGRILVGVVSDRVGSRVRILRRIAFASLATMLLLAACAGLHLRIIATFAFVLAAVVSVADNGLGYTSVADAAGEAWAGKALGVQNTGQFIAASAVGPGIGALVGACGYPLAFALVGVASLLAIPLVPREDRHR
jgi:MFS family permease